MKIDYKEYKLSVAEYVIAASGFLLLSVGVCMLFYNSLIPVIFTLPLFVVFVRVFRKAKCKARRRTLSLQFKDMVQALSASLSAGTSFENAFVSAHGEMLRIYGKDSYIVRELRVIIHGVRLNENVEDLLKDFGDRSGIPDIYDFSQVVAVAKRTGGDLVKIMKRTAENISQKYSVETEIETVIAAKKYEQKIMTLMPFLIILYLRLTNKGYVDILYENVAGRIVMTVCLAVCILSYAWSAKIVDIGV